MLSPLHSQDLPNQEVLINRLVREIAKPKITTLLDFYMLDGKGSRLSELNPKSLDMLSQVDNPLVIIKS